MTGLSLSSLSDLDGRYDRLLCDIWGVVHNGVEHVPGAVSALTRFREKGGQVALVSNAPRPNSFVRQTLARLGVPQRAYDCVVTSGDVTQTLISEYRGRIVHHVGPIDDRNLFDGTGVLFGAADEAEVLVVSDLDDIGEDIADYEDQMAEWKMLGLTMICANPDKVVEVGDRMVLCGGALADAYAERGGEVVMAGKPFPPIYELARSRLAGLGLGGVTPERTLVIGDSVRTDATGARGEGADFLFITGSIHAPELHGDGSDADDAIVRALVAPSGANLVGFMRRLA
ncbi:MAG: TIGR01459 family HAD-type hydrolase [Hyphomicrobiaceae bacterium]|nr:TIGR01459 family HAD-type hydrolase [Hyphomicrobiaceae bacterium]